LTWFHFEDEEWVDEYVFHSFKPTIL
jgi:hypothetical protein